MKSKLGQCKLSFELEHENKNYLQQKCVSICFGLMKLKRNELIFVFYELGV